jgi:NAD(P)-dependent dehydrogenase (short-subunit alcohol dehydrogenase family)
VAADLLDSQQVDAALREGVERFGRVDAVCHLAGGFRMGEPVHQTSPDTWDFLFDINARTFVNVARAAVPHLLQQGGGKIVTVGAAAALRGGAQMGAYSASKSALIRLTEAMSAELKDKNINVNCVLPDHHRHAGESRGHAGCGSSSVGRASRSGRSDRLLVLPSAARFMARRSPSPASSDSARARLAQGRRK